MITLKDVSYRYHSGTEALAHVNISVPEGIHLLLGENGAGKTTLLHIIAGLLFPTEGTCEVDGEKTMDRNPSVLSKVFLLADNFTFPQPTVRMFAKYHSVFYPNFDESLFNENLNAFGLSGNEPFKALSLGSKRKSLLAYSLALGTEVLLLDEPVNGLDLSSKQILRRMIAGSMTDSRTIIVSTHTVSDLETLFDGVIMLRRREMILAASTSDIQKKLTFKKSTVPPVDAIFYTQAAGAFHSIVPADADNESDVDFVLLYFAMQGQQSKNVLNLINNQEP